MIMRLLFVLTVLLCSAPVYAQEYSVDTKSPETIVLPNIQTEKNNKLGYILNQPAYPVEPHFKQVKFIKQPEAKTLSERIDRLIHGIYIDIPPEYDHYGYEIRRHMKSILTPHDLHNTLVLPQKIKDANSARIILNYWKKELSEEIKEIEALMDERDTTIAQKTTFRYNKRIVTTFLPEAYEWVDSNIEFLEKMREISGEFYVNYPFYQIPDRNSRQEVQDLYDQREAALEQIIKYSPFRAMIY